MVKVLLFYGKFQQGMLMLLFTLFFLNCGVQLFYLRRNTTLTTLHHFNNIQIQLNLIRKTALKPTKKNDFGVKSQIILFL